ncbi:MAG: anthranilate synthase component I family protein [Balneolaceae bacterium]
MPQNSHYILEYIHHFKQFGNVLLLESQKNDHPASTKSYLAAKPRAWIKSKGSEITLFENGEERKSFRNPWDALQEFKKENKSWIFGYFGYDLKNQIEELESDNPSLVELPDMFFMIPEVLIEYSIDGTQKYILGEEEEKTELFRSEKREIHIFEKECTKKIEYLEKIKKAQKHISEGDYYEINLSHPLAFEFIGDPLDLYKSMKANGPVPFASYVFIDDISICCSSPERFLARKGKKVWSQPIKGTESRNLETDEEVIDSLYHSEKNRAENLMIVDLVRNDLSKIAKQGSVKVKDLFEIQSFETVHQMVSTVECEVEPETDSIEIIKACFPMGSMTGAPKISAMKSIEDLEDYKRGIYSGAIGYFSPNQDFDFNVVIRTAIIENNTLVYPVGGAITSDSNPEAEWEETLVKARALTNTLDLFIK